MLRHLEGLSKLWFIVQDRIIKYLRFKNTSNLRAFGYSTKPLKLDIFTLIAASCVLRFPSWFFYYALGFYVTVHEGRISLKMVLLSNGAQPSIFVSIIFLTYLPRQGMLLLFLTMVKLIILQSVKFHYMKLTLLK